MNSTLQPTTRGHVVGRKERLWYAAVAAVGLLLCPTLDAEDCEDCSQITGTMTISEGTLEVECVDVEPNARIIINSGGTLILTGENGNNVSCIDGRIELNASTATLEITENDHTFIGSGSIIGASNTACIDLSTANITLTSDITIEGALKIRSNGVSPTTFINNGAVIADAGTVELDTEYLDNQDSTANETGNWIVGSSGNELWFKVSSTEQAGAITVGGGTLDIDESIATSGELYFNSGTIEVASGKTFQAS